MTTTITYGTGWADDCDATTNYVTTIRIVLAAAGYVDCVAGDIGKAVTDDAAGIGNLVSYDNTNRYWFVASTSLVVDGSVMAITAGTGAGTSAAGSSFAPNVTCNGDAFTLYGTLDDASDEYFYIARDLTGISSVYRSVASYPKLTVRFKTSAANAGLQAKVIVGYDDGDTDTFTLGYSQDWKVTTNDLQAAHTVSTIKFVADDNPDATAAGLFYVYFDYAFQHAGTFTFPHVNTVTVNVPSKIAQLEIPGRDGDILQHLGMKTAEITVNISIVEGETWRSDSAYPEFDYLLTAISTDTWSYFTNSRPLIRCQVMFKNFTWETDEDGRMVLNLHFLVYKRGSYSLFSDYSWIWGRA